mmetsp:Transcript_19618/g.43664  ORF Transcript_19618/g.43664 Transcript_19618/m.43664 type:complete len:231 (+) Transcript_19618:171-863(+)
MLPLAAVSLDLWTGLLGLLCSRFGLPRAKASPSDSTGGRSGMKASKLPFLLRLRPFATWSPLGVASDPVEAGLLREFGLTRGGVPLARPQTDSTSPRPSMHRENTLSGVFGSCRQRSTAHASSSSGGGRGPIAIGILVPDVGNLEVIGSGIDIPAKIGDAVTGSSRSPSSAIGVIQATDQLLGPDSTNVLPDAGTAFFAPLLSVVIFVISEELAMPSIAAPARSPWGAEV